MLELIKKNIYLSFGLAAMTRDKIVDLGKKLSEESKLTQEEGEKFVDELLNYADDTKKSFEKQVGEVTEKTMNKMKFPCHKNLEKLEKLEEEIKQLREMVEKLADK